MSTSCLDSQLIFDFLRTIISTFIFETHNPIFSWDLLEPLMKLSRFTFLTRCTQSLSLNCRIQNTQEIPPSCLLLTHAQTFERGVRAINAPSHWTKQQRAAFENLLFRPPKIRRSDRLISFILCLLGTGVVWIRHKMKERC